MRSLEKTRFVVTRRCRINTIERHRELFAARMPELEQITGTRFRRLGPDAREEAVHNVITLTWKYYHAMVIKGRGEEEGILFNVLWFAIKQTRAGRTIQGTGRRKPKDVIDYARRGRTKVEHADFTYFIGDETPVPDAAAFRIDLPEFLATLTERQRGMALDLASGMGTTEVARKHGVTPGAVSQFRPRFRHLLEQFYGDAA